MTAGYVIDKLCRLMSPDLPLTIEPGRLARKGAMIAGQYAIQDMQRLGGLLHDRSGQVMFRLEFTHDDGQRVTFIMGNIRANLKLVCQRCLGGMELNIDNPVYLGVAIDQAAADRLPDDCEPLMTGDEPVSLAALIEDELILALPIAAMHDKNECQATKLLTGINSKRQDNPFAVLKTLRKL